MKQSPQWIYEKVYCQRGDIENRIKELHDLEIDRTSCSSFWANQFRVLLTATAYVLMQELHLRAAGTACARAQVGTLRERLLKLGARVLVSVRRVVVPLPTSFPFLPAFRPVAPPLGAATGQSSQLQTQPISAPAAVAALPSVFLANWTVWISELRDSFARPRHQPQLPRPTSQLAALAAVSNGVHE